MGLKVVASIQLQGGMADCLLNAAFLTLTSMSGTAVSAKGHLSVSIISFHPD